jgi:hypothetical protein
MGELIEMIKHGRRPSVIDRKTQLSRRENYLGAQMLRRNKKALSQGTKTQINFKLRKFAELQPSAQLGI